MTPAERAHIDEAARAFAQAAVAATAELRSYAAAVEIGQGILWINLVAALSGAEQWLRAAFACGSASEEPPVVPELDELARAAESWDAALASCGPNDADQAIWIEAIRGSLKRWTEVPVTTGQEVERLLRDESYKVVMFYGGVDFTPGANFLFAVMPKRGQGAQWHRDIIPALRRYLKRFQSRFTALVSGAEGYDAEDARRLLANRQRGNNDRLWLAFEWAEQGGTRRGRFREVEWNG
jgi:hypothetical protein